MTTLDESPAIYTIRQGVTFHTFSQLISIHANEYAAYGVFFPTIPYDIESDIPGQGVFFSDYPLRCLIRGIPRTGLFFPLFLTI